MVHQFMTQEPVVVQGIWHMGKVPASYHWPA